MKCVIPSINIKKSLNLRVEEVETIKQIFKSDYVPPEQRSAFGKAIQSLAKIGDEISIEPTLDGLLLKSVNSTRSCLAFYVFKPRFFQHYDDGSPRPVDQNSSPRFRLAAKCCLNVFKTLNNMDRLVEQCQISLNEAQSRVVFSLQCKHGIVKNFNLTYMEADSLNCSLSKSSSPNIIKAESKLYADVIANFPTSLAELTLVVKRRSMSVRNYIDGDVADPLTSFSTTMTLSHDEFESFQVNTETSVSFCLKEVKAALVFAEFVGLQVSLYFDDAGKPMFINMDSDPSFEMTFIISTISESLSQTSSASETSVVHNTSTLHDKTNPSTSQHSKGMTGTNGAQKKLGILASTSAIRSTSRPPPSKARRTEESSVAKSRVTHSSSAVIQNNNMTSEVEIKPRLHSLMNDTSISLLPTANNTHLEKPTDDVDELLREIDQDNRVLKSASNKKIKSTFFGRKKPAGKQSDTQKYLNEILAEDSEDD